MQPRSVCKFYRTVRAFHIREARRSFSNNLLVYGDDVAAAKKNKSPIVALESTIVTHGMPYPDNLHTAIRVEEAVREKGAVPATIGILNGRIHIGLTHEQLEILARADPLKTMKCSRRDLSYILTQKLNGGTTVSATMLLANRADIPIMATGGIGGVHREAELTFDISTDLMELGHTPVAVVCSGVKSILDIPKTLEYLETQGVPVVSLGDTDRFPAFYCVETHDKVKTPYKLSTPKEASNFIKTQRALGLDTGILFAVPIPAKYALDPNQMEDAISKALESAASKSVRGKAVTPFLLEELNKITSGVSLQANIALIENNARVAAEIAVEHSQGERATPSSRNLECRPSLKGNPVVIGGAIMDTTLQVKDEEITADGRTHAGKSRENCGGVGRNVANALISLGLNGTRLISVVGKDQAGQAIIKSLGDGAQTIERLPDINTARCTVIIDRKGECHFIISEMEAIAAISPDLINKYRSQIQDASFLVLDGNLPLNAMRFALELATDYNIPVWYEPTDINRATKIFEAGEAWENVLHFVSPNRNELLTIAKYFGLPVTKAASALEIKETAEKLAEIIPVVITTLGSQGVLVSREGLENQPFYSPNGKLIRNSSISSRFYPPVSQISKDSKEIFSVSGCGDCLTAAVLYGIHKNFDEINCFSVALKAAALSLKSFDTVPDTLSSLRQP